MELASSERNLQVPNGPCKSQMVMENLLREKKKNVLEPNQTYMEDDCEVFIFLFGHP